jgi:SRSO17 transposase
MRFAWVGVDGRYGKEPAFLRALDNMNEVFVADVHRTQRIWTEWPVLVVPPARPGRGRPAKQRGRPRWTRSRWRTLVKRFDAADWLRCDLRDSTLGALRIALAHRWVWVWDGEEEAPRCWHLIIRREVKSEKTIKYTLSNAPAETPLLRLGQMQGYHYQNARSFEDAKGECGLADY